MNWYYVEAGEKRGPITEAELDSLYSSGKVQSNTLVWHDGAADWMPFSKVKGVAGAPPAGGVVCAECGRIFPPDEVIKFGEAHVCGGCKPVFMQKVREGVVTPGGNMVYASFVLRLGAYMLDWIITNGVAALFGFVVGFATSSADPTTARVAGIISSAFGFILSIAYFTFFHGKFGATPGKMVCKIKVVTAEGHPISYARALGRFFAAILSAMICLIGYIMAATDSAERRALHDRICNTRVIKK